MSRRSKKLKNKAQCERAHAQKRAMERYGLEYKRGHLDIIRKGIRNGEVILLFRISNRLSLRLWKYEDKDIYLLYDHNRQEVVTFLTKEMSQNSYSWYEDDEESDSLEESDEEFDDSSSFQKNIHDECKSFKDFMKNDLLFANHKQQRESALKQARK